MDHLDLLPEWKDDERMRILMGPMPTLKDSVAFNSRIIFWTAALQNWCKVKDTLTFTLADAQAAFRRGTQVPVSLPQIFQHMIKNGDFITVEDVMKPINDTESWISWSKRILITPSKWAWNAIQDTVGGMGLENKVFINQKVLEDRGEELLRNYWKIPPCNLYFNPENVITVEELYRTTCSSTPLNLEDLNLILHYLAKKRRIAIQAHLGKSLVKIAKPGQTEPLLITEMESAEFELRASEDKLKERLKVLQNEAFDLRSEAKRSLSLGARSQAMSSLRKKKRCEKSLDAVLLALENVSTCIQHIQDSTLNKQVLGAFQLGANALKSSIASTGGVDKVSTEIDTLQDVLDECKDITDTMAFGVQAQESLSEDDLEQELEQLMELRPAESDENVNKGLSVSSLPSVPQINPLKTMEQRERMQMQF